MTTEFLTGLFGKLPAHGDFIHRTLPSDFVTVWDEWLQHYIAGSQEQIGEQWLDFYLTSPIWRFMISEGCIDDNSWVGVMLPSVDKIGRYFPISIITKVPYAVCSLEFLLSDNAWLEEIESIALQALEGDLTADELLTEISTLDIKHNNIYTKKQSIANTSPVVITMDFEEQIPASVSGYMLDAILQKSVSSYSAWSTQGSEHVPPSVFYSQGLPDINGIEAMMNGNWSWQQPYQINMA